MDFQKNPAKSRIKTLDSRDFFQETRRKALLLLGLGVGRWMRPSFWGW
jgi:hypothetical protein